MKETYLTAEQIAKALRISKEKVSLLAKHGLFPKPLKLHTGAVHRAFQRRGILPISPPLIFLIV